jgi:hypothetical protein
MAPQAGLVPRATSPGRVARSLRQPECHSRRARVARRIGRFPQLAHSGSRVKGVFNRGIWTSVASARRHSRRTTETAPLSPRGQSKQPNATTSPDTAFELSRRRQIPPFAAVYTREPSGVRQRSVGGDPLRKKCSDHCHRPRQAMTVLRLNRPCGPPRAPERWMRRSGCK